MVNGCKQFVCCPDYRGCACLEALTAHVEITIGVTAYVHWTEVVSISECNSILSLLEQVVSSSNSSLSSTSAKRSDSSSVKHGCILEVPCDS